MEVVGGVVVKVEGFVIDQSGCYRVRLPGSRIMDEGSGFIIGHKARELEIRRNNWIGGPRGRGRDTDVGIVLKAHEAASRRMFELMREGPYHSDGPTGPGVLEEDPGSPI
ncbi:hypothetical protein SUGI_1225340 [Cryptomeria japonica]|uniref:Uncharacterized protein n=1 Tax=Cryptomeria japonica TaxID=3369 RepID=A0AAD3RPC3_CRYJA|nr:hypothetical protein SUGI_1225340 [Cryptomeria japonica]